MPRLMKIVTILICQTHGYW